MRNQMLWLLERDWSIVGGVGCDDSLRVHHLLTSQVGLAHFPQADWRCGWVWDGHIQEMLSVMLSHVWSDFWLQTACTDVIERDLQCEIPLQLCKRQLSSSPLLPHHCGCHVPLHKQTCTLNTSAYSTNTWGRITKQTLQKFALRQIFIC